MKIDNNQMSYINSQVHGRKSELDVYSRPERKPRLGGSSITKFIVAGVALLELAGLSGCTGLIKGKLFSERAAETPPPSDQRIEKSFFVEPSGQPKTFLCAWAPEMGRGWQGEFINLLVNESQHCNIEFEITENFLIGKIIHPSFPNDRNRWKEALRIPITKHYYYEKNKDSYGRETNEWIENSGRSHWSARPMMTLNLSAIQIWDQDPGSSYVASNVEDIEWDREKNFLGFSLDLTDPSQGSELQQKVRVNFLKFDHDPTFKKIPYHQENAKYLNILHVMGRRIEGIEPELYVAHWDLRTTQKIYLNGFPSRHETTIKTAIEKANIAFEKIGAVPPGFKAFEPVVANLNHPFDLRYPSVTWIDDQRISLHAPLGIGMAHADVRNGKIIWGGVVIYGGMLERYINWYTPVEASSSSSSSALSGLLRLPRNSTLASEMFSIPLKMKSVPEFSSFGFSMTPQLASALAVADSQLGQLKAERPLEKGVGPSQPQSISPAFERMATDLIRKAQGDVEGVAQDFSQKALSEWMGFKRESPEQNVIQSLGSSRQQKLREILLDKNASHRRSMLMSLFNNGSSFFVETERTVENMMGSWNGSEARSRRSFQEMLDSVVMDLSLHELGHFFGCGHQFKENILPQTGSVPSRYLKALAAKATAEAGFTNMSTMMGYRNGRTEMAVPAEELNYQINDELVLRYLYKGEYPVMDSDKDDFRYIALPPSGRIPSWTQVKDGDKTKKMRVSYFPSCNDYEASLGADPFCNRWDRGSRAEDIVASYFENISDNLVASLYSLAGGSGDAQGAEMRLWGKSLDTFSRVRLFYDEMRRRLRSEEYSKLWNRLRRDEDALFEFSRACQQANPTGDKVHNPVLREIFSDPDMVDLCRANNLALKEFKFFVSLPDGDYSLIDHSHRYISGGYLEGDARRNYGHIFGSWYQLANFPLKYSALFTLTTANPYLVYSPYGLVSNSFYDTEEDKYLYRTLYPQEYTQLISDTVRYNLRFASSGQDDLTTTGLSVLAAGQMVPYQDYFSNDFKQLSSGYNRKLNQQNEFRVSMVVVLLKAIPPEVNSGVPPNRYKKFTATIFDYFTDQKPSARDVYILPKGYIFVRANRMFLFPVSQMHFYDSESAYVLAYKVDYDYDDSDQLYKNSVKFALTELHDKVVSSCLDGFSQSGLSHFFQNDNSDFSGFYIPPNIADDSDKGKIRKFYESIDEEFAKYEEKMKGKIPANSSQRNMLAVCDESLRGVGQIVSSAAIMNGNWLDITRNYFMVK